VIDAVGFANCHYDIQDNDSDKDDNDFEDDSDGLEL